MATLAQLMQNVLPQKDPLLPNETRRIILKELLHAYTLDFLYNHPLYRRLNFYGGTCLHILYNLNRLSEDIDLDGSGQTDISRLEDNLLDFFRSTVGYPAVTAHSQVGEWGVRRITLKFPILHDLGLSSHANEALHLKVEVSQHNQVSIIRKTPVLLYGRSFVVAHFSLESLMAGKMLACLERSFQKGTGAKIKGRDYYDLLWFMQRKVWPLEEKLARDGRQIYTVQSAMTILSEKISKIRRSDLAVDLLPLFEQRSFIDSWLDAVHENFREYAREYLSPG